MRHQKGFTLLEMLIVVAILSVVAAIAIPALTHIWNENNFKTSFGFHPDRYWSNEEREILLPTVQEKLAILKAAADEANKRVSELRQLPTTTNPAEALARIQNLRDAIQVQDVSEKSYSKALLSAKYFYFFKENDEK